MKLTPVGDFLIILPTHNESAAITDTLQVIYRHLQQSSFWNQQSYAVLVADNGSTDQTYEIVKKQIQLYPNLIATHTASAGRGNALKESFRDFSADYYIYLDCDLPVSLSHLDEMALLLQESSTDAVVAYRNDTHRPLLRRLLTRCLNLFNRIFLGLRFHDAQAGFKGFSYQAAQIIANSCRDNHFFLDSEALFWIKKHGLSVTEMPVTWIERRFAHRKSSVKVLRDIIVMSRQGLRLSLRHNQRLWKVAIALFIVVGCGTIIFTNHDPDLGWHLRAGELILKQGAVPWHDIFLYTVPQHRWIDHEWLVDIWLWLLWKNNLWMVARALFAGMSIVPFIVWLRRSTSPLSWLFIIATSATVASTMGVRVQSIGYFLTWILLELLFGPRRIKSPVAAVTVGTVIMFVWANLHGSFPAGLFVIYLYFLTYGITHIVQKKPARQWLPILFIGTVLPTLVTLTTPYGMDLYKEIWELTVSRENHLYVQEWRPMISNPHTLDLLITLLFFLGLASAFRKRPTASLIALAFYGSYLGTLRSGPLFMIASLFVVIYGLDHFEKTLLHVQQRNPFSHRQLAILYFCYFFITAQIIAYSITSVKNIISYNTSHNNDSIGTVAALQQLRSCTDVSLFNSYTFGGTIIYAFPQQKIFIDGRGPAWHYLDGTSVMQNFIDTVRAKSPDWHDTFTRFNINTALLEVDDHRTLIKRLTDEGWQVYNQNESFEILTKERHNDNCQNPLATIHLP